MFDIFVNYRTVDERFGAASAFEALTRRFGSDRVFLDHVSIRPGAEYSDEINAALDEARILVVLIGPQWLSHDPSTGIRLIDREGDWVRREIRRALQRGITIVPVLLDGVALPPPEDLPPDVRRILRHQAVEVRHRSLGADLDRLGDSVARWLPEPPAVTTGTRLRTWWRAAAVLPAVAFLPFAGDSFHREPVASTVVGDPRTADPCALVEASAFSRYGETTLDRAYGAFQRCDVLVTPDSGAEVDIEARFEDDPPEEGIATARRVGTIGVVAWPKESDLCERTLTLPPGNGGISVVIRAEVDDGPNTTPLCEVADLAATAAASTLDTAHRTGRQLPRRPFSADSLAQVDSCSLLDSDALAAVIPGVDAIDFDAGYGHWSCTWSSTTDDMEASLRFDQGVPLDAGDGQPARVGGLAAFVTQEWEGPGSCTVRVVYRSRPGQHEQTVVELLMMTVTENEDREVPVCTMATELATAAVAVLPAKGTS